MPPIPRREKMSLSDARIVFISISMNICKE